MSDSSFIAPNGQQQAERMHVDTHLAHVTCSGSTPTAVAYATPQDLTPFSAVSSFNYPATADSTLLTPVSAAGSPPIQQRGPKPLRQSYHPSTASAQQPTPPGSSRMFFGGYDVSVSSQESSPMTVHPQHETHFDIAYMGSSPKDNSAPVPYYGHYGVSEPSTESDYPGSANNYQGYVNVEPSFFIKAAPTPDSQISGRTGIVHATTGPPHTPILAEPHPTMLRHPRPATIEDLRDPTMLQPVAPGRPGQPLGSKTSKKRNKKPTRGHKASSHLNTHSTKGPGEVQMPLLMLSDKASEEEKYLFELRRKFVDEKGKGMWDQMKSAYEKRFGCTKEKAALQMKISRAVCKHAIWPEGEKDLLRQAFLYEEERRYARIIARMKELGGAQIWEWKPQHIEAQLVKMGLEEPTMDEATKLRRRNRLAQRKRAAQQQQRSNALMHWPRPMDMTHAQYPFPHHLGGTQGTYEVVADTAMALSEEPEYTSEQEEEVLGQLDRKYAIKEESHSPTFHPTPDMMDISFTRSGIGPNQSVSSHQSERVARQACEQLMAHRLQHKHFNTPA